MYVNTFTISFFIFFQENWPWVYKASFACAPAQQPLRSRKPCGRPDRLLPLQRQHNNLLHLLCQSPAADMNRTQRTSLSSRSEKKSMGCKADR